MTQSQTPISVKAIKAFTDNYIWLLQHKDIKQITLVDPGDADVCINYIEQHGLQLANILITHDHSDHIGGLEKLTTYCQEHQWPLTIYGSKKHTSLNYDVCLEEDDVIYMANLDVSFSIIELPGHTLDHIAYISDDILFCGDTLFSGGCGRIFSGSAKQLHNSLNKLRQLPERTRVYCTHEYTLANLNFALTIEPYNTELVHYYNQVTNLRDKNLKTLPSSIMLEKKINPFLRCHLPEISHAVTEFSNKNLLDELSVFTALRELKDNF